MVLPRGFIGILNLTCQIQRSDPFFDPFFYSIFIDVEDVSYTHPKDRNIAMVFQNYALYPHINGYKNMSFGLRLKRYPKAEIEKRI